MDQQERVTTFDEAIIRMIRSRAMRIWTAMPGIVQKVNMTTMTIDAVVAVTGLFVDTENATQDMEPVVCPDMPLVFPGGGGAFMEFPVTKGDEVLLIFAARSIDNWWGNSGVQKQSEQGRMHNLSDGFAIPGIRSRPNAKTLDPNVVRIRNDANSAYIEFNPAAGSVKIAAPGGVNINGATINSAGEVTNAAGKVLGTHVHPGVTAGGAVTGAPQ
jgi:hypothetical protein